METRKRTIMKAILWNLIGLASMALVGLLMTGSIAIGGAMAVVNTVIGFIAYVFYERVWAGIAWGRISILGGAHHG